MNTGTKQLVLPAIKPGFGPGEGLAQDLLVAGGTSCIPLPLPYRYLYHPAGIPAWHTHGRPCVMPQGTSHRALVGCYKLLLWAAEQSFNYSGKGVFTHHESQESSYQLLLPSFLENVTWAAQLQAKPLAFKSPPSFSRQNDPTHIPCFFHSSAFLGSCIFSHTYIVTIGHSFCFHSSHISVHLCTRMLSTQLHSQPCSSYKYYPTASEVTVWVKSIVILCHYCRLVPTKDCWQKCHRALTRALCVCGCTEF